MATIDCSVYFNNRVASYDNVTGILSITLGAALIKEQVVERVLTDVQASATNKRTDLNFPVAIKAFPSNPSTTIITRSDGNSTNPVEETQLEEDLNLVLFYRYDKALQASNVVRAGD